MQSSTAIAFRALVMLICMISIPLFAIFGKDLPEVIKNLLAGRLVVRVTDPDPGSHTPAGVANGNLPARPDSPFSEPASYRAEGSGNGPPGAQPTSVRASAANSAVAQPAGFQAPSESRPISSDQGSGIGVQGSAVGRQASEVRNQEPVANSSAAAAAGNSDGEQFRRAEARLRELGATHYTLETWGSDNNRYRFVCKMAIGGNPGVNRYFQAIEDDPWRAMNAVLQQVETWRSQQPQ